MDPPLRWLLPPSLKAGHSLKIGPDGFGIALRDVKPPVNP